MDYCCSVARRLARLRELEETLTAATPEALAVLDELFAPVLAPGERPAVDLTLDLYRRKLVRSGENLETAEASLRVEAAHDVELCVRRDALAATLSRKLVHLYRTCRDRLDRQALALLGFDGHTPRRPQAVLEHSRGVATGLERLDQELDSPEWEKLRSLLKDEARDLAPQIAELNRTILAVERQRQRAEEAAARRKEACDEFDRDYLAVGRVVEAILRMAGKHEEADRIHPSTRQLDRK
jgi:hypothetical protein